MKTDLAKEFYNASADSEQNYPDSSRSKEIFGRYKTQIENLGIEKKDCLELCCGNGRLSFFMEKLGAVMTGIDCSDAALEIASSYKKAHNMSSVFHLGDVLELDKLCKKFDIVFFLQNNIAEFSAQDVQTIAKQASSILKPQGKLCISLKNNHNASNEKIVSQINIKDKGTFVYESWKWNTQKVLEIVNQHFSKIILQKNIFTHNGCEHDWIECIK